MFALIIDQNTDYPDYSILLIWVQKISFPSEDAPVMVCCFGWGMQKHTTKNICEDISAPFSLTGP